MKMIYAYLMYFVVLCHYIHMANGVCCNYGGSCQGGKDRRYGILGCNFFCCNCDGGCPLSMQIKHPNSPFLEKGSKLKAKLSVGDTSPSYILSPNGKFSAEMQSDGNFVIYDLITKRAVWAINSGRGDSDDFVVFQNDGNLVHYVEETVLFGAFKTYKAPWASNTMHRGNRVALENDGRLYVYNSQNVAVWRS